MGKGFGVIGLVFLKGLWIDKYLLFMDVIYLRKFVIVIFF